MRQTKALVLLLQILLLLPVFAAKPKVKSKAKPNENKIELIRRNYQLKQMWALSRNYYHGTTVPKDKVKALAWQIIYTSALPKSYPGLRVLLDVYQKGLKKEQIDQAKFIAHKLKKEFSLEFRLDEKSFSKAFEFYKDRDKDKKKITLGDFTSLADFLKHVKKDNPELYKAYKIKLSHLEEEAINPVVFGQVIVNGPEPAEGVGTVHLDKIDKGGYFLTEAKSPLAFELSGYQRVGREFEDVATIVNLGRIILNPEPKARRSSIVGQIYPANKIAQVGIVLRLKSQRRHIIPWLLPVVPITFLSNGQFYATDLSPNAYDLIISYQGKVIQKEIKLYPGAVKNLPKIHLDKIS